MLFAPADEALQSDAPVTVGDVLACEVCGETLEYSGRGRKPKYCASHKPARGRADTPTVKTAGKPNSKAREAAGVLAQVNGLVAVGLSVAPGAWRMPATASAIAEANEAFEEAAARALAADPKLTTLILRAGQVSGGVSLLIAYGAFGIAVAPVAVMEARANRAAEVDSNADRS